MSSAGHEVGEYPPAEHLLRDLPFEVEVCSPQHQRAHLDPRSWSPGELAVVVDVVGGSLCAAVVAPDWMATSSLELRLGPLPPGVPLTLDTRVLRAGRRSVTLESELTVPGVPAQVGAAMLSFARLERRADNLDLSGRDVTPGARYRFGPPAGAGAVDVAARIGTRVLDATAGRTETELAPYVRNSFGALNGGVVAALAGTAAQACCGDGWMVDELAVHHLGQGRVGPVRTAATVRWAGPARRVVRVEVHDVGAEAPDVDATDATDAPDGRCMAVADVGLCTADAQVGI